MLLCVFHVVYPNPDLIIHLFNWYYRKYISKSYQFQIKLIFITYIVVPKWATLCFFLFLLHLQTLPTIFFIETISNTYQMHIHFRSNLYCFIRMICSVLFLFSLPFQTMSTVDFIDTLSKTDSYSLHKLLYQNKLLWTSMKQVLNM